MSIKLDIVCIGMALVDSIIKGFDPKPVSKSGFLAVSGALSVGGEAVNEAIAASKLGMKTGIFCTLGEDDAGEMILNALQRNGVNTGTVLLSRDHPTPVTTMFVDDNGNRKSITNRAHRYNFHPELNPACFRDSRAILLGSLFRAPFDDPEIIRSILQTAKSSGQLVFADTKLPNFHALTLSDLKESLPLIDYITPNEDEAKYYSGKTTPAEMADVFLDFGIRNVVIKLGEKGCFFKNAAESFYLPAFSITPVDATGAGDNFIAGYASEILRGNSAFGSLRFANACGAICTTAMGASAALKNREQVLKFMAVQ